MTETYSLGITGLNANTQFTAETVVIPDSACQGNVDNTVYGAMGYTMQQGAQVLGKRRDGSLAWFTFDAERSTPSVPVLKAV